MKTVVWDQGCVFLAASLTRTAKEALKVRLTSRMSITQADTGAKHKQGQLHGFFTLLLVIQMKKYDRQKIYVYIYNAFALLKTPCFLSVSLHRLSLLLPVSHLPAWAGNRGKMVNLESDGACEPGLAQINRAEPLPAQFQQCFPNRTSSSLIFWCCFATDTLSECN